MEEDEGLVRISIAIPSEMYKWLENHREINRSQLFRNAVDMKRNPGVRKISSLMFLASIMGIVFSIALIGIALIPSPIIAEFRAVLALLGGLLAIATMGCYAREQKRIKLVKE
jgi:hypothetical protein